MEDYLKGIDEDLWISIEKGPYHGDRVHAVGTAGTSEEVIVQENKQKVNDKRYLLKDLVCSRIIL